MMKVRKVEDIVDEVVRGVELLEVDQEVNPVKLRDPARVDRENLQRGNFFTKHAENMMIRCQLLNYCSNGSLKYSGLQNNRHCGGYYY